jgi:hypothetical protein
MNCKFNTVLTVWPIWCARLTGLLCLTGLGVLTGCMSTENPRNFDETGKLTEATVYDVSQTPRVPLADAWVVVEYWYVAGNGLVEAKDLCRVSYSLRSDEMGKVRFPERTKHTVKINAYKQGYAYKTARIKPPYEVSLQPSVRTRAEEFRNSIKASSWSQCYARENDLRALERRKYFLELAKMQANLADPEENYLLNRNREMIENFEQSERERQK